MTHRYALTDKKVNTLKPAKPGERYDVLDALMPSMLVRVTSSGHKSFMFRTRFPGHANPSRRVLGEVGVMSIAAARDKARKWHELLARGIDPDVHEKQEQEQQRLAALRLKRDNFLTVAEAYFAYVQREGLRKARVIEREIRKEFVSVWAERPIADIDAADLRLIIETIVKRGSPSQAHTMFERARSLWRWAIDTGAYGLVNAPTDRLRAKALIGTKIKRQRILSNDELQAFWTAIKQDGYPWQPLYKLLLLTGARLTEVAEARWSEFNLDDQLWVVPGERYKTGQPHVVPLTNDMTELLKSLPRFNSGDFVFSANWGRAPVKNFSKPKRRIDVRMVNALGREPDDWVVHDLRRTMRSALSALPIEQHVREIVIGHVQPGVKATYDRYAYLDEKRRALELWSARLRSIVEPPPDNVTPLRRAEGA